MIFHSKDDLHVYVPSVHDKHDSGLPQCDLHEGRLGHVEVDSWQVAPPAIVRILGPVQRTEVRGGHRGRGNSLHAPLLLLALDLVAGPATVPVTEQRGAKGIGTHPVTVREGIPVLAHSSF